MLKNKRLSKHIKIITLIIFLKIIALYIMKSYIFADPLAEHMRVPSQIIQQHFFN